MWTEQVRSMIGTGILETLYMTVVSTVFGYLFGLPMGILLCITDKEGLKPNKVVYKILDVIANIVRSIPFLILLILLIPFTRLLLGKSYGSTATIVPLTTDGSGDSVYRKNGRVFVEGSRLRSHRSSKGNGRKQQQNHLQGIAC